MFSKINCYQLKMAPVFTDQSDDLKGVESTSGELHGDELVATLQREIEWLQDSASASIAQPVRVDSEEIRENEKELTSTIQIEMREMAEKLKGLMTKLIEKQAAEELERTSVDRALETFQKAEKPIEELNLCLGKDQDDLDKAQKEVEAALQKKNEVKVRFEKACFDEGEKLRLKYAENGYKCKVGGKYLKYSREYGRAFIEGKHLEWKRGQNRILGDREPMQEKPWPIAKEFQAAQAALRHARAKAVDLEKRLESHHEQLKKAHADLEAAHRNYGEAREKFGAGETLAFKASEVKACEKEIDLALDQLSSIKEVVARFQQEASGVKESLQGMQSELHDLLSSVRL